MSFIPKAHEIYKHFKGNLYQIVAIAEHTETGEQLVVYQALYGDFKIYARPITMFVSRVDKEKYPEVTQEFRFELQGPESARQKEAMAEQTVEQGSRVYVEPTQSIQLEKHENVQITKSVNVSTVTETSKAVVTQATGSCVQVDVIPEEEEELQLDPLVLEFLDADSYEQRLSILAGLHHRITDEMITTMAIACDIEINDGDIEERYESLKNCLLTLERYECNRLR